MNVILFLGFYLISFLVGRGILIIFTTRDKTAELDSNNISGISYDTFYPIISLIFFGNFLFLINFFTSLLNIIPFVALLIILFIFINLRDLKIINNLKSFFIKHIFIPSLLSITTFGSWFHFDSGAYHLNYQQWLRTEKIALGLANLNFGYGFSSILEYLQAVLWFKDNLVFIFFINIIFYCLLFSFIYEAIYSSDNFLKTSSFLLLTYGFLDNFGYLGGANGFFKVQAIAKPDMPFAIIFVLLSQVIIDKILRKDYRVSDIKIFAYFSLFLIQIKLLGAYLGLLLIFYLFNYMQNSKISFIKILTTSKVPIFISIFWFFKNFLLSGCFLFPLASTCVKSVSWYIDGYINNYIYETKIAQRAYFFGDNLIEWSEVFINKGFNKQILINFTISILLIVIMRKFLFERKSNRIVSTVIFLISTIYIFTWLISSPAPRWGAHIFPFLIVSLGIGFECKKRIFENKIFTNLFLGVLFITVALIPRLYSYQSFFNEYKKIFVVAVPEVSYINNLSNNGYIVDSTKNQSQQCWVNKMCLLSNKRIVEEKFYDFRLFLPDGSKKW